MVLLVSLDFPDPKDIEVSLASLANPDNLVLMDLRELWVTWDPLVDPVKLELAVPLEREDDLDLLDQPVFVV